jgi:ABC-2 type transport system ATP-binding protein
MMDQFGVYERLSCYDNLVIFADIYGVSHSKIKEVLTRVGLESDAKTPASKLSKGMRARLSLARVFMHSPKLIFLDEPTSGLDPQTMNQIHKLILEKKKDGCTIFLTTHNMEEAYKLCDNVALLNEGVIVEQGNPEEVCRKYNHQKKIKIHLTSGEDMELDHNREAASEIECLLSEGMLETINSSEPTLETVFLELTGRKLEEDY